MMRMIAMIYLTVAAAALNAADTETISYKDLLSRNNANIAQLGMGMTRDQVVALMKSYSSEVRNGPLSNPYKAESFQRGADNYEVLYYLTHSHPPFTPIRDSQATPVVLKNGAVVGWGQSALHGLK